MKPIDSKHKKRHGSVNGQEERRMKIKKFNYKRIPFNFEIIIFKWGDGIQDLKLRSIFQKLIGRSQEHHTSNPKASESPHSNQCMESDSLDLEHLNQTSNLPNASLMNKETFFTLTPIKYPGTNPYPLGHITYIIGNYNLPLYF